MKHERWKARMTRLEHSGASVLGRRRRLARARSSGSLARCFCATAMISATPALAGPRWRSAWSPLPVGGRLQEEGREGEPAGARERGNGGTLRPRGDFLLRRAIATSLACSIAGALLASSASLAAVPHTVLPGERLWSISSANNLTTRTVAVYNGLPEDALLVAGTTVYVPTVQEGGAALAAVAPVPRTGSSAVAGAPASEDSTVSTPTVTPAPGMDHVPSP